VNLGPLCFRADASVAMGTGHVMRCLALAQAWQEAGGTAVYALAQTNGAIDARLRSQHIKLATIAATPGSALDGQQLIETARVHSCTWVVVDGYHFGAEYQQALKSAGLKVLFVDDTGHATHYCSELILNQNAHASAEMYSSRDSGTRLLLGSRYAMLRREFWSWSEFKRNVPSQGRKVLVTMGGSDPENLTLRVIEALAQANVDGLEAAIVVGGSNPHIESLRRAAKDSAKKIRLLNDVPNMPELIAWADVAVSAAGSTCWEMCFLGLPAILVDVAPNQTPVAKELDRLGAAAHIGDAASASPEAIAARLKSLLDSQPARLTMSRQASRLVDGRGAERVVAAIRNGSLRLRKVEEGDCRVLWEWANDPAVRRVSFSNEPIPWERHVEWFHAKLEDQNTLLYIALNGERVPVGHVRYDLNGSKAVMSINLAMAFRGKGYGGAIMELATDEVFRATETKAIHAFVKPDNQPSLKLFTNAGFGREATVAIRGQQAVHFVLDRSRTT